MYKGKISRWIFKVVFLEMRILRIRKYVMWPTNLIKLQLTLFFSTHGAYLHSINSLLVFKNYSRSYKMAP